MEIGALEVPEVALAGQADQAARETRAGRDLLGVGGGRVGEGGGQSRYSSSGSRSGVPAFPCSRPGTARTWELGVS
jgi:hypothetical protein